MVGLLDNQVHVHISSSLCFDYCVHHFLANIEFIPKAKPFLRGLLSLHLLGKSQKAGALLYGE